MVPPRWNIPRLQREEKQDSPHVPGKSGIALESDSFILSRSSANTQPERKQKCGEGGGGAQMNTQNMNNATLYTQVRGSARLNASMWMGDVPADHMSMPVPYLPSLYSGSSGALQSATGARNVARTASPPESNSETANGGAGVQKIHTGCLSSHTTKHRAVGIDRAALSTVPYSSPVPPGDHVLRDHAFQLHVVPRDPWCKHGGRTACSCARGNRMCSIRENEAAKYKPDRPISR